MTSLQERLFELRDKKYGEFQRRLIPTVAPETIIGVRTPELRALAKKAAKEKNDDANLARELQGFMRELPHCYFEENQFHAFLISEESDFVVCMEALEKFLPYVDNWATCDQLSPETFRRNCEKLLPYIDRWLCSGHIYTVRFGIGMLMRYYLDDHFDEKYADQVASIPLNRTFYPGRGSSAGDREPEAGGRPYYISMMIAWYFATALAKQYDRILPYIEEKRLDPWTHNKTIQKAVESYRITPEQKGYLKTLKIRR